MDELRDVGARLKRSVAPTKPEPPAPVAAEPGESLRLRAKMIGVLLRDARAAAGRTIDECARRLHVTPEQMEAWEFGDAVPTLPQLELLAYFLEIPVSHFWGHHTLQATREDFTRAQTEYMALRDRMIGALLRAAREERGLSIDMLSIETGIAVEMIEGYELGDYTLPMHELTVLANGVRKNMSYFLESSSHLGDLLTMRERWKNFSELPEPVRAFASNPLNVGFIELAMMLASMPVERLRDMGESILNITM
jgi:transcriptional regulator with XRE-family HTH domain